MSASAVATAPEDPERLSHRGVGFSVYRQGDYWRYSIDGMGWMGWSHNRDRAIQAARETIGTRDDADEFVMDRHDLCG